MIIAPSPIELWTPPWWRLPRWADLTRYTTGKVRQNSTGKIKVNTAGKMLGSGHGVNSAQPCCGGCTGFCGGGGPSFFNVALSGFTLKTCGLSSDGFYYTISGSSGFTLEDIGHFGPAIGCQWVRNTPLTETPWTITRYSNAACTTLAPITDVYYLRTVITLTSASGTGLSITLRYGPIDTSTPTDPLPAGNVDSIFSGQGGASRCITSTTVSNDLTIINGKLMYGGSAVVARC